MNCPVCGAAAQAGETVCRTCGAPLTSSGLVALPAGTALAGGQYTLSRVLGQGGFGITYAGRDTRLGLQVAIKELFLDGSSRRGKMVVAPGNISSAEYLATRTGFLDEAKVLASFNDPGIVKVTNYFEENSTAYLVMEFLEGSTLGSLIQKRGSMPPDVVFEVARSVGKTLELIHQRGLLHRDIKPDNIFFNQTGRIVLIDFGSVRAFVTGKTLSHTRLVTPGYAPLEQYGNSGRFGPYTDIYALGATLLHALTGQMPPPATDLMLGTPLPPLPEATLPGLRRAVGQAMALRVEDRPQSAQAFLSILTTTTRTSKPTAAVPPSSPAPAPAPVPRSPAPPSPVRQPPVSRPAAPRPGSVPAWPVAVAPKPTPAFPPPPPAPPPSPPVSTPVPPPPGATPKPVPTPSPPSASTTTAPPPPNLPAARPPPPVTRIFFIVLSSLLGAGLSALSVGEYVAAPVQEIHYVLAAVGGAGVGALAGALLWFALPLALPAAAAAAAYFYTQGAGFHWPTVVSASVASAVLAIVFLIFIRRISL